MALVLTRKVGQVVDIGNNISVEVGRISQGTVRLKIDAPPDVPIVRREAADKEPVERGDETTDAPSQDG